VAAEQEAARVAAAEEAARSAAEAEAARIAAAEEAAREEAARLAAAAEEHARRIAEEAEAARKAKEAEEEAAMRAHEAAAQEAWSAVQDRALEAHEAATRSSDRAAQWEAEKARISEAERAARLQNSKRFAVYDEDIRNALPVRELETGASGEVDVGDVTVTEGWGAGGAEEPYDGPFGCDGLLSTTGRDTMGRPVVVVRLSCLPHGSTVRAAAFKWVLSKLEPIAQGGDYVLVLMLAGEDGRAVSIPGWYLVAAYRKLPRAAKKNVKRIVFVRPSGMLSVLLAVLRPFLSQKVYRKMVTLADISEIDRATEGEVLASSL